MLCKAGDAAPAEIILSDPQACSSITAAGRTILGELATLYDRTPGGFLELLMAMLYSFTHASAEWRPRAEQYLLLLQVSMCAVTLLFMLCLCTLKSEKVTDARIVISGPLPTYRRGSERFSRLFALQSWLCGWCACNGLGYVDNWSSFWEQPALYRRDGLHPSPLGSVVLSRNIERAIR
ncbi:hypothetical protein SRHO_G00301400 [Serrasalmus rhombeus]